MAPSPCGNLYCGEFSHPVWDKTGVLHEGIIMVDVLFFPEHIVSPLFMQEGDMDMF